MTEALSLLEEIKSDLMLVLGALAKDLTEEDFVEIESMGMTLDRELIAAAVNSL